MSLSAAIAHLCQLMDIETPSDMILPEYRKKMGNFPERCMRLCAWARLRRAHRSGVRTGIVEDCLADAIERVAGRCYEQFYGWDCEPDANAYAPNTVLQLLTEELGRAPHEHELRKMLRRARFEERIDLTTVQSLGHASDLLQERAERGVPGLVVGDVMSDVLNRMDRDRGDDPMP
jgi:hypothetical protein